MSLVGTTVGLHPMCDKSVILQAKIMKPNFGHSELIMIQLLLLMFFPNGRLLMVLDHVKEGDFYFRTWPVQLLIKVLSKLCRERIKYPGNPKGTLKKEISYFPYFPVYCSRFNLSPPERSL